MEFEDYLVASGMRIEPEEEGGQMVQPDYRAIINKFNASLKKNARVWFSMYIENRVHNLHSADGWKAVKSKFLTYFNPIGSTKEQQIKTWKGLKWKPEEEKLTDFVFRFSQHMSLVTQMKKKDITLCVVYTKRNVPIPRRCTNSSRCSGKSLKRYNFRRIKYLWFNY